MRILLWHGYLLAGSGSNIYTANVARSWCRSGHDVLVLCQELHADRFDFVDMSGDLDEAALAALEEPVEGRCAVLRPRIGELLPVYVYDEYEGFTAKRFVDLYESELDSYTQANVDALGLAIESFRPDAIITGHEVMGPYIAQQACDRTGTRFVTKLHGSALEYAVKVQDRYLRYAEEGLNAAHRVVGGSRYMLDAAAMVIPGPWRDQAEVVNPGCDVELFRPAARTSSEAAVVAYVGALIVAKGIHHLLAALGRTKPRPLEAAIVGFGGFEDQLQVLADALGRGDSGRALAVAETGDGRPLETLAPFLSAGPDDGYWTRLAEIPVRFLGRLDHGPLAKALPHFDLLVVPSVVPEAFGMVGAEAAACGVLPIVPDHSGIAELGRALEDHLGIPGLLTFDATDPIAGIAAAIDRVLDLGIERRRELGKRASDFAHRQWSWDTVAARLLAIATE